jgi:hypothetical protein
MRFAVAGIALLIALALGGPAGAQSLDDSFTRLQQGLGRLTAAHPEQGRALAGIGRDAVALQAVSGRIRDSDAADFARSIGYDAELLARAVEAGNPEAASIIGDVALDLRVKRSAGSGMGAGSAFPGRVSVRVVTLRMGKSAPGYVIGLNPVGWSGREPMFRLPKLSPASGSVPPGRYEVSARAGGSTVARDIVRIGLAAEDDVAIELPVP